MREIKFRAWDKEVNHMYHNSGHVIIDMKGNCFNLQTGVKLEPLLFTGLHDKNGKEIYEGDVVTDAEGRWLKVQFNESGDFFGPCFQGIITIFQNPSPKVIDKYKIEVIGNIYEHPELLKEAQGC